MVNKSDNSRIAIKSIGDFASQLAIATKDLSECNRRIFSFVNSFEEETSVFGRIRSSR